MASFASRAQAFSPINSMPELPFVSTYWNCKPAKKLSAPHPFAKIFSKLKN